MRTLEELIDREDPAWPLVQKWIGEASVPVEVLPAEATAGDIALHATQVTTRSPMGAIAYQTAGILIDHGWLRVLGAGQHPQFQRSLPTWNENRANQFYLVADDAIGGFFAINGGGLGEDMRNMYYYAPDTLRWEPLKFGYSQFLVWAMSDRLAEYYETMRWDGWISEVKSLTGDQVMNIYPFLWCKGPPIQERSRRPISVAEQFSMQFEIQKQLEAET